MTPLLIDTLQRTGCTSGVLGSLLLALNNGFSGFGFVLFVVSNFCWAGFVLITHANGLLLQQTIFTATSVIGIWRWRVAPAQTIRNSPH